MKVVIIGGGLFGSVLSAMLAEKKVDHVILDAGEPHAASQCAAAVMKREWASSLRDDEYTFAMETLQRLYPNYIQLHGTGKTAFHTLSPELVMRKSVRERVVHIDGDSGTVTCESFAQFFGDIYCAAGWWTRDLFPHVEMKGGKGQAIITSDDLGPARIVTYAPYRQAISFPRLDKKHWFGDGTAIKPENYNTLHTCKTLKRAMDFGVDEYQIRTGIRPYAASTGRKIGYYERVGKRAVIATGGAKIGMLLAPLFAEQFMRELEII